MRANCLKVVNFLEMLSFYFEILFGVFVFWSRMGGLISGKENMIMLQDCSVNMWMLWNCDVFRLLLNGRYENET